MSERKVKLYDTDSVMSLNAFRQMDEEEQRRDRAFAFLIVSLFLVIPLFGGFAFALIDQKWAALLLLATCWGAGLLVGIGNRRRITRSFYQVEDVTGLVSVIPTDDAETIERMRTGGAIACFSSDNGRYLLFAYNWLLKLGALPHDGRIIAYVVKGDSLIRSYGIDCDANADIVCIPVNQLELTQESLYRLYGESTLVGVTTLEILIASERPEQ